MLIKDCRTKYVEEKEITDNIYSAISGDDLYELRFYLSDLYKQLKYYSFNQLSELYGGIANELYLVHKSGSLIKYYVDSREWIPVNYINPSIKASKTRWGSESYKSNSDDATWAVQKVYLRADCKNLVQTELKVRDILKNTSANLGREAEKIINNNRQDYSVVFPHEKMLWTKEEVMKLTSLTDNQVELLAILNPHMVLTVKEDEENAEYKLFKRPFLADMLINNMFILNVQDDIEQVNLYQNLFKNYKNSCQEIDYLQKYIDNELQEDLTNTDLTQLKEEIKRLDNEKNSIMEGNLKSVAEFNDKLSALNKDIENLKAQIESAREEIKEKNNQIEYLKNQVLLDNQYTEALQEDIERKDREINKLSAAVSNVKYEVLEKKDDLVQKLFTVTEKFDTILNTDDNVDIDLLKKYISATNKFIVAYNNIEHEVIVNRQKEGMKLAQLNGVKIGRPSLEIPEEYYKARLMVKDGVLKPVDAMYYAKISKSTWYKLTHSITDNAFDSYCNENNITYNISEIESILEIAKKNRIEMDLNKHTRGTKNG